MELKMQNSHEIYEFFKEQDLIELGDLVGSAETKEENDFYAMVFNFFLQQGQEELINKEFVG